MKKWIWQIQCVLTVHTLSTIDSFQSFSHVESYTFFLALFLSRRQSVIGVPMWSDSPLTESVRALLSYFILFNISFFFLISFIVFFNVIRREQWTWFVVMCTQIKWKSTKKKNTRTRKDSNFCFFLLFNRLYGCFVLFQRAFILTNENVANTREE